MTASPPRRPIRIIALFIIVLGAALTAWLAFSSPWDSDDLVVDDFVGEFSDSELMVCGHGHFELGFAGELRRRILKMTPDDNDASHCVIIEFNGKLRPGEFWLSGEGRYQTGRGVWSFTPAKGHASEVKSVGLMLSCFCSASDEPATFEGALRIDEVNPPTGKLVLSVTTAKGRILKTALPLRRVTWDTRYGHF